MQKMFDLRFVSMLAKLFFSFVGGAVLFPGQAAAIKAGFIPEFSEHDYVIQAGDLSVRLSPTGRVISLRDGQNHEHLSVNFAPPLISLIVAGSQEAGTDEVIKLEPERVRCGKRLANCRFFFAGRIRADVAIAEKRGYATFELSQVRNPRGKDIRIVLWGPYPVDIYQRVGDILGVAYGRDYAIGVMGLNPKTLAGAPFEYPQFTQIADIVDPVPVGGEASRTSRNYFSISAARVTGYGTLLQFYSRDYTRERYFSPYNFQGVDWQQPVQALPEPLGALPGSGIAVYGVKRSGDQQPGEHLRDVMARDILHVIGTIEQHEGLPHPLIDGVWAKLSPGSRHRYMDVEGLTGQNISEAAELARSAGFRWLYHREWSWGVFKHGGEFPVNDVYGGTDAGLAKAVAIAGEQNIRVGTHTVSGFLRSHDDGLIRDELTPWLAEQGRALLASPLTPGGTEILLERTKPFDTNAFGRESGYKYIRIDDELIGYLRMEAEDSGHIRLSHIQRGDHGTRSAHHKAGALVRKLWYLEPFFSAYHAGPELLEPMTSRIAEAVNNTGLRLIAYDGLESWVRTGHDSLLASQFVLSIYNKLEDKEDFHNEASVITHFNWHLHNRLNWGELRGSVFTQQQKYRWANQPLFARNLLPNALGAYFATTGDTPVETQWVGSKVASFDAAFTLQEHIDVLRRKPEHLNAMRLWLEATEANAFSDTERMIMRDPDSRFHLEELKPGERWRLWDEAEDGSRSNPRIVVRREGPHPTMNVAPGARVSVSSEQDKGYPADNVVDEFTGVEEDEFAHNRVSGVSEWAAVDDDESPWVELNWDNSQRINRVILFDRARLAADTLAGVLQFSDGSEIKVDNIPANGNGRHITFPEKEVVSVRFVITETKGMNPGLAEFVVVGQSR